MTTIINTPTTGNDDSSSGLALIIGIVLVLVLGGLFLYYILPSLRNDVPQSQPNTEINVELPTPTTDTTPQPAQ